ncbi:uncharacterized protein LOC131053322 [Cryptomeria japonica]|uniref:uncharacterized protein LOC131053322 n=1 Tax=Cryptomeria japonica TaxID=3369 RepID=UPI0025ABA731|nr:uncharacterized protein LOC131053322 [Cryptomeria japonica]
MDHLCSFSHWDNWVTWKWMSLRVIPSHGDIASGLSSLAKRKLAKWTPPLQFSFKLNFDGVAKGNPGKSGIGVVLFDHNYMIVKVVGKFIGVDSNNSAEFHALSFGLDLAISLGIKDIIIEGDSMLIFHSVSAKKCVSWHLQYLLDRILAQLKCFSTFTISHCYREINVIVDYLANKVVVECAEYLEVSPRDIPASCISILY